VLQQLQTAKVRDVETQAVVEFRFYLYFIWSVLACSRGLNQWAVCVLCFLVTFMSDVSLMTDFVKIIMQYVNVFVIVS
jgi:hypothetical protein